MKRKKRRGEKAISFVIYTCYIFPVLTYFHVTSLFSSLFFSPLIHCLLSSCFLLCSLQLLSLLKTLFKHLCPKVPFTALQHQQPPGKLWDGGLQTTCHSLQLTGSYFLRTESRGTSQLFVTWAQPYRQPGAQYKPCPVIRTWHNINF